MPLGILGAMPQEIDALLPHLWAPTARERAGRRFIRGLLWGRDTVVVFSRWGKVAAASTTTELILDHDVEAVVFFGIAGALDPALRAGDVVIARDLFQHDLDASPFFPPTEVPLLHRSALPTDDDLSRDLCRAAEAFLQADLPLVAPGLVPADRLDDLIRNRRVLRADIASGDAVIASDAARARVRARVPSAACVEMEGAAAAQVCFEHALPFACVRFISDSSGESIASDVAPFFNGLAGAYTVGILKRWIQR
jgi:adenosylhomocysteine nucleosidase